MSKYLLFLLPILLLGACKNDDDTSTQLDVDLENRLKDLSPDGSLSYFQMPSSGNFSAIPQDPKNPLTTEKVELGRLLFHETALAISPMQEITSGTFSCASCHFASAGFQANRFQGIGEGGVGFAQNGFDRDAMHNFDEQELDVQPIRTPTAMNGAYQINMLWNGQFGATGLNEGTQDAWVYGTPIEANFLGFEGLETQAIAGLKVHRLGIDSTVMEMNDYKRLFDTAFGDVAEEERYSSQNAGLAIAAYERTLLANQSPYQKWLSGEVDAMSDMQKRGALLFFGKANCNSCHTGPALNKMDFEALGMLDLVQNGEETFKTSSDDPVRMGRGQFTGRDEDMYRFKVPQLYNLKDSPFYGHGASFESIEEVLVYKNNAVRENLDVPTSQLSEEFVPLNLTPTEIEELAEFLREGLHDNNLARYEPAVLPSGNCFPVNDLQSQLDLGCN